MSIEARLKELKSCMMEEEEELRMTKEEERAIKTLIDRMRRDGSFVKRNIKKSTWDEHVQILKMVKVNQNNARKNRNKRRRKSLLKEKKELEAILAEASACKKQRNK